MTRSYDYANHTMTQIGYQNLDVMTVYSTTSNAKDILSELTEYTSLLSDDSRKALSTVFGLMSREGFEDTFLKAYYKNGTRAAYQSLLETLVRGTGWRHILPVNKAVKQMVFYQLRHHREWLVGVLDEMLKSKPEKFYPEDGIHIFETDMAFTIADNEHRLYKRVYTKTKRVVAQVVIPWITMSENIWQDHPVIYEAFLRFIWDAAIVIHDTKYDEGQSRFVRFLKSTPLIEPVIESSILQNREYHGYPQFLVHLQNPGIKLKDITVSC